MSKHSNNLQLGCGPDILPDFCNTDIENWSGQCDYVLDARDLSIFPDNRFELVYSRQMLEHIAEWDTLPALKEWRRVLKPGGKVRISVPDLAQVFYCWLIDKSIEEHTALNNIYGKLYPRNHRYERRQHLTGFTFVRLKRLLEEVGFVDVVQLEDEKLILLVEATK
jgi:predicted SAM-dependent methyltransferase